MFRFRFESLLNHRRHEEEVAQKMLFEAREELRREQKQFKRIKRLQRENVYHLKHLQSSILAPHEITLSLHYIQKISDQLERQREKVHQAGQQVDRRKKTLVSAVKRRKILERLKEKEHRRYQQDESRKEMKFMDEIAVTRHARGQS